MTWTDTSDITTLTNCQVHCGEKELFESQALVAA